MIDNISLLLIAFTLTINKAYYYNFRKSIKCKSKTLYVNLEIINY